MRFKTSPGGRSLSPGLFVFMVLLAAPMGLHSLPISPLFPLSLSLTQWYRYPPDYSDVRFSVNSPLVYGSLILRDPDGLESIQPEIRTFNARLRPFKHLALFAGSLSGTGIASRARNPVSPCNSPVFRQVRPPRGMILRPSTTLETGYVGTEIGPTALRIAAIAAPEDPAGIPGWGCISSTIPNLFPGGFGYSLSLFSGIRQIDCRDETSWFIASPQLPTTHLLFPAGELIVFNPLMSASCSFFGNISELRESRAAVHADVSARWKFLSLGGVWYQADRGFMDFAGSTDTIMERKLIAPALLIPFPGPTRIKLQVQFLAAEDLLLVKKFNAENSIRRYYGVQAMLGDSSLKLQASVEKVDETTDIAGSIRLPRLFHPSLQWELSGKGSIPDAAGDIAMMEETKLDSTLVWRPGRRFRLECTGIREQEAAGLPPEYQGKVRISSTLLSDRSFSLFCSAEVSRGSASKSDYARLYLKTTFTR